MWENTRAQREDRGEGGGGESFLLYGDVKRRTKKRERERMKRNSTYQSSAQIANKSFFRAKMYLYDV